MFILRRITSEWNEINTCLGEQYQFIPKNTNSYEFYRTYKVHLTQDPDEEITQEFKKSVENDVYGFLVYGKEVMPLFANSQYYIMVGDGKTFANLTLRLPK